MPNFNVVTPVMIDRAEAMWQYCIQCGEKKEAIEEWNRYVSKNPNFLFEVETDVDFSNARFEEIPIKFCYVGGLFDLVGNNINSLKNLPTIANRIDLSSNDLNSLCGIHDIKNCVSIGLSGNYIVEGGIGLILINGLQRVSFGIKSEIDSIAAMNFIRALKIIRKYFNQGKDGLLACANELEENGLEEFAKL